MPLPVPVNNAPLPQSYEAARVALAECQRIDECKEWADRAQALASYARQADDDTLEKMAQRIRARATRRAGELLKTFQSDGGRPAKTSTGTHTSFPQSQREAAESAGMSKHQEVQAVRVANVPEPDFEAAVESETPPTVTALAERGKQTAAEKPKPPGFADATHVLGAMRRFAEQCSRHRAEYVAGGLMPSEHDEARRLVRKIDGWLDRFIVNLRSEEAA